MGQWVITVCGIAILTVLCDIILPQGETKKYIKTVCGVVVTLVMIQPIVNLCFSTIDTDYEANEIKVQQSYIDNVKRKQNEAAINSVTDILNSKGITVKEISLSADLTEVTVRFDVGYSEKYSEEVKNVFSRYFPKLNIVTYWK